ncbi:MAG: hypothetical protein R3A44_22185 [Caldilineaceae bacterium]
MFWSDAVKISAISRCALLAFVFLYAFVLPFICWGALAAPGHPHALPHPVFMDPPHPPTPLHAVTDCNDVAAHRGDADSHVPAGRATPDTSAVSLLLLIDLGDLFVIPIVQRFYTEFPCDHSGQSAEDRVQTPPPRSST